MKTNSKKIVVCREKEYQIIKQRVESFLTHGTSSNLYVTGVPGSGKTHVIKNVLHALQQPFSMINCAV